MTRNEPNGEGEACESLQNLVREGKLLEAASQGGNTMRLIFKNSLVAIYVGSSWRTYLQSSVSVFLPGQPAPKSLALVTQGPFSRAYLEITSKTKI